MTLINFFSMKLDVIIEWKNDYRKLKIKKHAHKALLIDTDYIESIDDFDDAIRDYLFVLYGKSFHRDVDFIVHDYDDLLASLKL